MVHFGDPLFDIIRRTVHERAIVCMVEDVRIEPVALGDDAGVLGSIAVYLEYGHD